MIRRMVAMFRRRTLDSDLDVEIRHHLETLEQEHRARGLSPEDARNSAERDFGNVAAMQQLYRERRGMPTLETIGRDIRFAVRALRRSPGVTFTVLLTLTLGIGVSTTVFSVANAVLLRPLPYPEPDRLAVISEELREPFHPGVRFPPLTDFFAERDRLTSFESVIGIGPAGMGLSLVGIGEPEELFAGPVAASMCSIFRVRPILGRCFTAEEERTASHVALLSYQLWQRKFNSDPNIIGRTLTMSDKAIYAVVGVMPPQFDLHAAKYDLWIPEPPHHVFGWNVVVGRLKPGVDIRQALAEARTIQRQVLPQDNEDNGGRRIFVRPLRDSIARDAKSSLLILLAAVGLVLLVTCANVANLLLSRAAERSREFAVRESLGAGRWRIARELATEGLILAATGAIAGLIAAHWLLHVVRVAADPWLPRMNELTIDWRVLCFTAGVAALSGLLFGLLPALRLARPDLASAISARSEAAIGGRHKRSLMNALVVFQTAICMVAMMGAGLLVNTVVRLRSIDLGIRPDHVAMVSIMARFNPESFITEVLDRVRAIPGVQAAGTINLPPPGSGFAPQPFRLLGTAAGSYPFRANSVVASPGYFEAMGIPLLRGRGFDPHDSPGSAMVAVVNESLARKYWPAEDPLGKQLILPGKTERTYEIVGVAGNVRQSGLREPAQDQIYMSYTQGSTSRTTLIVRTVDDPMAIAPVLKREIRAIDKDQTLTDFTTMEKNLSDAIRQPHFFMIVLGVFGALALVLTSLGVAGLVAYSVSRRTREIGLRMACGATSEDLLSMFAGTNLKLIATGLVLGAGGCFAVTRYTTSLLYGITSNDPVTFLTVAAVLTMVSLGAALAAALRATTIDPVVALRQD